MLLPGIFGGFQGGLHGQCHVFWIQVTFFLLGLFPSFPLCIPSLGKVYILCTCWFSHCVNCHVSWSWAVDGLPLKRVFSSLAIVTFLEPYLVNWHSVLFPYEWSIVHPWTLLCNCITFLVYLHDFIFYHSADRLQSRC